MRRMRWLTIAIVLVLSACGAPADYQLIFASDRDGGLQLFVTGLDSATAVNVTNREGTAYGPAWSPRGDWVLFQTWWDPTGSDLYLMRPDGSALRNLTPDSASYGSGGFSPDGTLIAFSRRPRGASHDSSEIYVMPIEGGEVRRLTTNTVYDVSPRFSPDGRRIAFCRQVAKPDSTNEGGLGGIVVADADGSNDRLLTGQDGFDCLPEWSPNGRRIAFHRCASPACDILVMDADGRNLMNLTPDDFDNRWPRWSPDGRWIAYTSVQNEQSDIWIMRPDGSGKRRITVHPGRDEVADWRPR